MSVTAFALATLVGTAPVEPEVQRPSSIDGPAETTTTAGAEAPPEATDDTAAVDDAAAEVPAEADEPVAAEESAEPTTATQPGPAALVAPAEAPAQPSDNQVFTIAEGARDGSPPYYDASDEAALRERYGLEVPPETPPRTAKWRCFIADPTCGTSFEINATSAYAYRTRQGDVRRQEDLRWHSGRVQYDFWLNLPVMVETLGKQRFTRMTLGPKGGVIFSDTGALWGNLGVAGRYWLGRGKFAPSVEFTSALSYRIGGRPTQDLGGEDPKFTMTRGPVGFTGDVGVGIGGFGAIIVGGQYDSPLAREDVPERFRVSAGGMFFVGFRGNIAWGAPAAAAVVTHGLTQRFAKEP